MIGFAESLAAPETAWSLRDAGHEVKAFTRAGEKPPLRRARGIELVEVAAPEEDADRAVAEIAAALDGADVLLPLDDEALALSERAIAGTQVRLAGPTGSNVEVALDKRRQIELAEHSGFGVPTTTVFASVAETRSATSSLPFPGIVRPARALMFEDRRLVHPRAALYADSSELDSALSSISPQAPLLVQPWLRGTSEGFFGLATPDGIAAPSAHERIRMVNPQGSHSSACRSREVDPVVAEAAARMLAAVGWRGLFMVELLRDGDRVPWFVELNGRTWGSMSLSRRMGFEYPAWAVAQAMHESFRPSAPAEQALPITCRHLGSELVHLMIVMRGKHSRAITTWPSRWQTAREVLSVRRSDCWYNLRPGERSVFVADTLQQVLKPVLAKVR